MTYSSNGRPMFAITTTKNDYFGVNRQIRTMQFPEDPSFGRLGFTFHRNDVLTTLGRVIHEGSNADRQSVVNMDTGPYAFALSLRPNLGLMALRLRNTVQVA